MKVNTKSKVQYVDEETCNDDSDYKYTMRMTLEEENVQEVNCVQRSGHYQTKLFSDVQGGSSTIQFQINTGATCIVIWISDLPKDHTIQRTTKKLCKVKMVEPRSNKKFKMECVMVEDAPISVIGACPAQQMGLIRVPVVPVLAMTAEAHAELDRESVLRDFHSVFDDKVGCFEGFLYLEVDHFACPVQIPVRNAPVTMKGLVKSELDCLSLKSYCPSKDQLTGFQG